MTKVINVDTGKIKELYKHNDIYKAALEFCYTRERSARNGVVDINKFRRDLKAHGTEASKEEMITFFKRLQDLKLGKVSTGYKKPARFLLDANLISIGKVALGKNSTMLKHVTRTKLPHATQVEEPKLEIKPQIVETKPGAIETSTGIILIRKGKFEVELPLNLTKEEVKGAVTVFRILDTVA